MIRPNPFLKIDVAEKLASLLIPTAHRQPPNRFGESESLNQPDRDPLLQQPASAHDRAVVSIQLGLLHVRPDTCSFLSCPQPASWSLFASAGYRQFLRTTTAGLFI